MHAYTVGIDLHKRSLFWTILDEEKNIVWQGRTAATKEAIAEAVSKIPGNVSKTRVAVEPLTNWTWLADILNDLGIMDIRLANPQAVGLIAKNRLKNDKVDSKILAELLHSGFLPEAYAAPEETRSLRDIVRWRARLVTVRTMLKNRIHSILMRHGIQEPTSDIFGKRGRVWLDETADTIKEKEQIKSLLRVLDSTEQELVLLRNLFRRLVNKTPTARLLRTVPGIGTTIALVIAAEVGDFSRFPSPDKLASFGGLVPSSYSSGDAIRHGHITKKGSRILRWAMVQAAQRINPSWGHLWHFYDGIAKRVGTKKAKVALARKLLSICWYLSMRKEPFRFVHASGSMK